jgi:AcrR family transcriptional regulator
MAGVAAAAGVSRQTVYAHYPSREALLAAVAERALARTLATIDAAQPEQGPPVEALERLIWAWWDSIEPNARLLQALVAAFPDVEGIHDFHAPIIERLVALVRRGQRSGDFDERLPVAWATAAFLGLMHAAAHEVAAGRLSAEEAGRALRRTVPRALGVASGRSAA